MIRDLIQPGYFMAKVDMKDAYFSIPICNKDRNYLALNYEGKLYRFRALPFGLSSAPYAYTRLVKPVAASLREKGMRLLVYLDDWIFLAESKERLRQQLSIAMKIFEDLGFIVNKEKSQLEPVQRIEFLGMTIDSRSFLFEVPEKKIANISGIAKQLLYSKEGVSLRAIAEFIGKVNSITIACKVATFFLRNLQMWLASFTPVSSEDYESIQTIPDRCRADLEWFLSDFPKYTSEPIVPPEPSMVISSDASDQGWGACCGEQTARGRWSISEKAWHINERELTACFFGLRCFAEKMRNSTVKVELDNTTAVWYLNKRGGTKSRALNLIALTIARWCLARGIHLIACYRPGVENVRADALSRNFEDSSDFSLDPVTAMSLFQRWGVPEVDLFASRSNAKCQKYFSFLPDPDSTAVDAFKQSWLGISAYAFPPFSLVGRVIAKAVRERARLILVCPRWPSQPWWPLVQQYSQDLVQIPRCPDLLTDPTGTPHPLLRKESFTLIACRI
ncbi:hypothetical protein Y032_0014g2204 [Ancylostoma ceylanicum]|uniref:Reverse transcriptase domain-containing protein n=1 Tax=Ancylostoma ceylanicum TaxID=53326 RepID=A0A016V9D6_9BILA|nr:hypothetical protein Y032_0014g2204 [Ancylostoma ceylanicum]